jgi:hypothetical protein
MGGACGPRGGEVESQKERAHYEDPDAGKVIKLSL